MPKLTMNHNLYIISIPLNRLADPHFIIEKIGLEQMQKIEKMTKENINNSKV